MEQPATGRTTGQRIADQRKHIGMSRPVFGGLVGRSAEWVKAIETGRLRAPRLPMLIRIAQVLGTDDLAELTGEEKLSSASFTKSRHERLEAITEALADYSFGAEPVAVAQLEGRVKQAWELWHGARHHRTAVSVVLPSLLTDARTAARLHDGLDRRRAAALLAQVYHLTQLYLSFQPVAELVHITGDRAMTAAMDADDPYAMAAGAWYLNHVFRDAGQQHEARVSLATRTADMLAPADNVEDLARWGLLQLAIALSYAKVGRDGDAWRHWDEADRAARSLGEGYSHPWLIFGTGMVNAYAVTMHIDLMHAGQAVAAADKLDLAAMPSVTRRSFHLAESARAYSLKREPVATLTLLGKAFDESPDTATFSLFARSAVPALAESGPASVKADAGRLAAKLGLTA
jgi:transcriptional regulator with XRE-family HTH domain